MEEALKQYDLPRITFVDDLKDAHFIIDGHFDQHDYHPDLKGVIIPYTGHNGIDLDAMRKHDLMLFITPTRSRYVAEKAIALMFALLGRVVHYHTLLQTGNWAERNTQKRQPWTSIQGKTVGLFGYGRIGKRIHHMLQGFDCDFATIDRGHDYEDNLLLVKNLTNLIQVSDVIFISTPLNKTTEGIFDQNKFARMNNKFLINVARGAICEEESLYQALKTGTLHGYASDVWYQYPKGKEAQLPSTYPIYDLDNVVLSNHSGGFTETTNKEVNEDLIKTLKQLEQEDYSKKLNLDTLL